MRNQLERYTIVYAQKGTKNVLETGRTFATLFADTDLRIRLLGARSETEFKRLMWEHMKELAEEQQQDSLGHRRQGSESSSEDKEDDPPSTVRPDFNLPCLLVCCLTAHRHHLGH